MAELRPASWPPSPINTARLLLREPEPSDRAAIIALFSSSEVNSYLGGPRDRDELERTVPDSPRRRAGFFVVDLNGKMIGIVTLERRDQERPGHLSPNAEEAELGYMFLPAAWGSGYATEACAAVLDWFAGIAPAEPVALCTQTANSASMQVAAKLGFTEVAIFEEFDAEQWFGVRLPSKSSS